MRIRDPAASPPKLAGGAGAAATSTPTVAATAGAGAGAGAAGAGAGAAEAAAAAAAAEEHFGEWRRRERVVGQLTRSVALPEVHVLDVSLIKTIVLRAHHAYVLTRDPFFSPLSLYTTPRASM